MKIGVEMCHGFIDDFGFADFSKAFDRVKDFGFQGMYYKSPTYISSNLDPGKLKEAKAYANELDLYLEFGLGRINPYNTKEDRKTWLLGGGNYSLALERIIASAADIGCHELVGVTAGWNGDFSGYFHFDRFRTDISWDAQLQATKGFLFQLAPILRNYGSRINIETHEEITSHEILRLIDDIGSDVVGVAFDTGNVLARAEHPTQAAIRVAPYCHQTHVKDAILIPTLTGVVRQVKPCGEGIVDFEKVLRTLNKFNPDLNLTLEDHKGLMVIDFFKEEWVKYHPDLDPKEVAQLYESAKLCEQKILSKEIPEPADYEAIPYSDQMIDRFRKSLEHLLNLTAEL